MLNSKNELTQFEFNGGVFYIKYEDAFIFGPQKIYFYYQGKNKMRPKLVGKTTLANDGKNLSEANFIITIVSDMEMQITLIGEEQEPEKWSLGCDSKDIFLNKK